MNEILINRTQKEIARCPKCNRASIEFRSNGTIRCKRCGYNEILGENNQKKITFIVNLSEKAYDFLLEYMKTQRTNKIDEVIEKAVLGLKELEVKE